MNIFGLGTPELLLILGILLLLFGKDRLPGLARSIGASFKALRSEFADQGEATKSTSDTPPPEHTDQQQNAPQKDVK